MNGRTARRDSAVLPRKQEMIRMTGTPTSSGLFSHEKRYPSMEYVELENRAEGFKAVFRGASDQSIEKHDGKGRSGGHKGSPREGVNFIDTAELYGTYGHIREALSPAGNRRSFKVLRLFGRGRRKRRRRKELDMDVLDIFLLHEQGRRLRGHRGSARILSERA